MAYITLADAKEYLSIPTLTTSDDDLLTDLIGAAQDAIDKITGETFEAAKNTDKKFDAIENVEGRLLRFGEFCASIDEVTNGDGVEVTSSEYVTVPANKPPYYAIKLLASAGKSWTYVTDPENAITVSAKWAYTATPEAHIKQACKRLVAWLYRQKDTSGEYDRPLLTGDGNVLMPSSIPSDILSLLRAEKSRT